MWISLQLDVHSTAVEHFIELRCSSGLELPKSSPGPPILSPATPIVGNPDPGEPKLVFTFRLQFDTS